MVMIVRSTIKSCPAVNDVWFTNCTLINLNLSTDLINLNRFKILIGFSDDRAKCPFSSEADRKDPDCNYSWKIDFFAFPSLSKTVTAHQNFKANMYSFVSSGQILVSK